MKTIGKVFAVCWFTVFTLFCLWASFCWPLAWIHGSRAVFISMSERAVVVVLAEKESSPELS
jgi:hypothetical protein